MAWISGVVSVPDRLKNTDDTRSSSRPAPSSASIVLAKVGAARLLAMASISARFSSKPFSMAGRKCSVRTLSKGGTSNGVVHRSSSGFGPAAALLLVDLVFFAAVFFAIVALVGVALALAGFFALLVMHILASASWAVL